ncbi:hypothetical protein CGLO_11476 [Colletotrichum gloeosporioides Cg-14]|uniref:Uncharacterized protein n=1 Tax=Colletotrichum gloeosporioides (strain Cg-14) TaxID=1237896 RepID=T0K866_COLGC|nr:hypothetical protein CGLO_11476 [Colletotrichum gloeosporioides Cg-14]
MNKLSSRLKGVHKVTF